MARSFTAQDTAAFPNADALDQKLREVADVRANAVALTRSRVYASAYPPEKTIQSIAILLASNLEKV